MMKPRDLVESLRPKAARGDFRVGDTVRVYVKIREGDKERIQLFEGTVIKKRRGGAGSGFTVRKLSYGVGVERVFPFDSPAIDRIETIQRGKVRRAKLYYLRKKKGREAAVGEGAEVGPEAGSGAVPPDVETKRESAPAPEVEASAASVT